MPTLMLKKMTLPSRQKMVTSVIQLSRLSAS